MKRTRVGAFSCGTRTIELFAIPGTRGGDFHLNPEGKPTEMNICIGYHRWYEVLQVLVHETMELCLIDVACRFRPAPDSAWSSDTYVFHANHAQFSEACARAGEFIAAAQYELAKVHRKAKREK